ncbi:MAG: DUF6206 family protein [Thermodesulfobacteriota bacterium]
MLTLDRELLERFEAGLDPQDLGASAVPAALLGYGEISAIFQIGQDRDTAYKRMPLFSGRPAAEAYEAMYHEYCGLLAEAGLNLPATGTVVVEVPGRPVTLYIAQRLLPQDRFAHRLIQARPPEEVRRLAGLILAEVGKVWRFCAARAPRLEIAIDGQLSNWVLAGEGGPEQGLLFVDTSTPFIRKNGVHQLDPDLILKAAPGLLRGLLKRLFAAEVLDRYYDPHKNMTDLAANLHKEQRPDLVPLFLEVINRDLPPGIEPLTAKNVEDYYRQDKLIWTLFLGTRRMDRWVRTKVLGRRYEFILPGRIKR